MILTSIAVLLVAPGSSNKAQIERYGFDLSSALKILQLIHFSHFYSGHLNVFLTISPQ